jgi:hypothetical protein
VGGPENLLSGLKMDFDTSFGRIWPQIVLAFGEVLFPIVVVFVLCEAYNKHDSTKDYHWLLFRKELCSTYCALLKFQEK